MCFKGSYRYFYSLTIIYCNKMLLIPFLRFCMVLVACEVIIRSAVFVVFYALLTSAEKLLPLYLFVYFFLKISYYKKRTWNSSTCKLFIMYSNVMLALYISQNVNGVPSFSWKFIVLKNTQI